MANDFFYGNIERDFSKVKFKYTKKEMKKNEDVKNEDGL